MTAARELRDAAARLEGHAYRATPGPWMARYTDPSGFPVDPVELTDFDDEHDDIDDLEGEFALVAGTALPRPGGRDQSSYEPQHVIAEYDDHDSPEQDRERWANLRWAALLNPAVAAPLTALLRAAAAAADEYPALDDPTSHLSRMVADPDQAGSYRHTADLIRTGLSLARLINGAAS